MNVGDQLFYIRTRDGQVVVDQAPRDVIVELRPDRGKTGMIITKTGFPVATQGGLKVGRLRQFNHLRGGGYGIVTSAEYVETDLSHFWRCVKREERRREHKQRNRTSDSPTTT